MGGLGEAPAQAKKSEQLRYASCSFIQRAHPKPPLVLVLDAGCCDRLWAVGETDPWPRGVGGLFVWACFPVQGRPEFGKFYV